MDTQTTAATEVKVPDIGDFKDVPIIDIHVKVGDPVNAEDPLITLESDKATMDVPAPSAGTIRQVLVKVGDGNAQPPRKEDWSRPGRREELMPHVARFKIPHVDVHALISATPEFYEYPTCDRDPLPWWSCGRVTLLGDAAHPMYPVGSNGASQAILDARCLADALVRSEHPRQALVAYEQKRLPMTAEIVRSNRRGGPEGVIDAVEQLAPQGFADIDTILSYEAREAIVRGYAAKAGFAARVVARQS